MKKFFLFYIFSFVTLNISAQELNGVGNFKIGMDTESFLKLAEIQSLNPKDLSFNSDLDKNTSDIFKNTHQLNNRVNIIHSPDVIDFYFMTDLGISGDWGYWYPTSIRFYKGNYSAPPPFGKPLKINNLRSISNLENPKFNGFCQNLLNFWAFFQGNRS